MATILIIEDDPAVRALVRATLSFCQHELVEAVDGPSALERSREVRPDLVLMDLELPGQPHGPALCKALASHVSSSRVIVVSGAGEDQEAASLELGARRFLRKPFSPLELIGTVESALGSAS